MPTRRLLVRSSSILAITTAAVLTLSCLPACGQSPEALPSTGWVALNETSPLSEPPVSEIHISTVDSVSLTLSISGLDVESAFHEGDTFQRLSLLGLSSTREQGRPEIPIVRMMLAIPDCDSYSLKVTPADSTEFSCGVVWPVPEQALGYQDEYEYVCEIFALDEDSYEEQVFHPGEPAVITEDGWVRDQRYVILELHPVRYNPGLSLLRCYSSLSVDIHFDNPVETNLQGVGPLESACRSVMENYEGRGALPARGGRGDTCSVSADWFTTVAGCASHRTDYLMIVEDSIIGVDTIDALAEKKSWYDCLSVAIVKVSDIASPISPQAIKDFIQDLYDTQTADNVPDGHLGYVLLIGDAHEAADPGQGQSNELLPAYEDSLYFSLETDDWVPTDHWYACVSGEDDYVQDLAIGRLAVGSTAELQTIVDKIIDYEPVPLSEPWTNDVFLSCSFANGDDGWQTHVNSTHSEITEVVDILANDVDVETMHLHVYTECQGQEPRYPMCLHNQYGRPLNRAAVDAGKHVVLLWGHGYPCGSLSFESKDVPLLDNAGKLPFWINMSCSTGNFANLDCECGPDGTSCDCLGEYLLRWGDVGAVAFFGATKPIGGHIYGPMLIDSLFDQANPMIGQAISEAKVRSYVQGGSLREMCACNLLGDPTLNIFVGDYTGYGGACDLVVSEWDTHMSPEEVDRGDEVTFECRVTNEGPDSTTINVPVVFDLYHGNGNLAASVTDVLEPMDAWGADTARAVWTAHEDSMGAYDLFVTVDPGHLIDELHEWNNTTAPLHFYVQWYSPGFPVSLATSDDASAPVAVCDISEEEGQEIIATYGHGSVAVIDGSGETLWSWAPSGAQRWASCAAVADFDNDGTPEIATVVHGLEPPLGNRDDWIYVLNSRDRASRVWKRAVVDETYSAPLVIDVDPIDGRPEVALVGVDDEGLGLLSVWNFTPETPNCSWDKPLGSGSAWERTSPPTSVNMGLHPADLVTWDYSPDDTLVVCRSAAGDLRWKLDISGLGGQRGFGIAAGGLDGDGEVLLASARASEGLLFIHSSVGPDTLWTASIPDTSEVVIGNVDSDSGLEIVCAGGCSVFVFDQDDPSGPLWRAGLAGTAIGEPLIGDFDGGNDVEIIVGALAPGGGSLVHILSVPLTPGALEAVVDPVEVPGEYTTGALCDLDGNGSNDIVFATNDAVLHRFEYWGMSNPRFEWPMYRHDTRNSGLYEQPVLGTLTQSTTWSGDMFIMGDVVVPDTLTLHLAADTSIEVLHDWDYLTSGRDSSLCELIVEGTLLSRADGLSRVTFTSDESPMATSPDWFGITLEPGSTCSLEFTDISGADKSLWAMSPDALDVRNSRFLSQKTIGVHLDACAAPAAVVDCIVDEALIGIRADSCAAAIEGNTLTGVSHYGIWLFDDRGSTVDGNDIDVAFGAPSSGTPCGIYCSNRFDAATISVGNNTVAMGDVAGEGICVYSVPAASPSLEGNDITGPGGSSGSSKGIRLVKTPATARGNRLSDFRHHFYVETETGQIPDLGDTNDPGNNATDEGALYNVYAQAKPPIDPIPAQMNWWGTYDPTARKFYSDGIDIEWEPYLNEDPNSREGQTEPDGVVARYDLQQNHPNPFNPTTVLSYSIPEQSRVRITIHDLGGRVVRLLLDEMRPPGEHSAAWNGRNERGQPVGSGVYFCRMRAGSFVKSRKLVVLK